LKIYKINLLLTNVEINLIGPLL